MCGEFSIQIKSLRRYARFLCLDADEADALLVNLLNRLKERGEDDCGDIRLTLFKTLQEIWIPVDRPALAARNRLDKLLAKLTPQDRAALLLCEFEGFSIAQAAVITGWAEHQLEARLARAHALTHFSRARRVLLVQNDAELAERLETLLAELGFDVVGPVDDARHAAAAAAVTRPDIIICEAALDAGGSALGDLNGLRRDLEIPVVFLSDDPDRHGHLCLSGRAWVVRKSPSTLELQKRINNVIKTSIR